MTNPLPPPLFLAIDDPTQVGDARRSAVALARELGLDEPDRGRLALVVTELGTNLFKHARQGEIVVIARDGGSRRSVEILAIDRGPGISDVARSMSDGYSTAGSPGNGLGAIRRLSDTFDLYSVPDVGTVIHAQIFDHTSTQEIREGFDYSAVSRPVAGETFCGDAWAIDARDDTVSVLVADGLGHGPLAHAASMAAVAVFREKAALGPESVIRAAHEALHATRGAALAVARISPSRRELHFAGVGNIAGVILTDERPNGTSLISHNGTVGHTLRKVQEFRYPWPSGSTLILNTDGLVSHWTLQGYPGLVPRGPAILAAVLYRDFRRTHDDATVMVVRDGGGAMP